MKTLAIILILSLGIVVFDSCKKDEIIQDEVASASIVYDTVFPNNWFPCYPGSYWIFDNGDTIIAGDWHLDSVRINLMTNQHETPVIVPSYNGNSVFNNRIASSAYLGMGLKFVFDSLGGWGGVGNQYSYTSTQCIAFDTSMQIYSVNYDPVQVVVQWHGQHPNYGWTGTNWYSKKYYAKNIGLIRWEYYQGDSITSSENLTSYHINW